MILLHQSIDLNTLSEGELNQHQNRDYYKAVKEFWRLHPEHKIQPKKIYLSEFDEEVKNAIALNLLRFRRHLNLSQAKTADLLQVSLSQYKKYENGTEMLRYDVSMRLSLKFGIPIFCLFRGSRYENYISLPDEYPGFDRIWFYANSLTDEYFSRLCRILSCFSKKPVISLPRYPHVTLKDFSDALLESEDIIYFAIAQGIRALREHLGLSQELIADYIDVSLSRYQEYEHETNRPRFNLLVAARYCIAMGINPFHVLVGTKFAKIRTMQNARIETIQNVIRDIDGSLLGALAPLVEGFYNSVKHKNGAIYFQ